MPAERKPELVVIDTLVSKTGVSIVVGHRGTDVEVDIRLPAGHGVRVALDGESRDRFIRAWAEAERVIEREDAELEHRRELEVPGAA